MFSPFFWLILPITVTICVAPVYICLRIKRLLFPSLSDVVESGINIPLRKCPQIGRIGAAAISKRPNRMRHIIQEGIVEEDIVNFESVPRINLI